MLKREAYLKFRMPATLDALERLPYDVTRASLYTAEELYDAFDPAEPESMERCYDTRVYRHFLATGALTQNPQELWGRNCHDTAVMEALQRFLQPVSPRRIIGVMGWHSLERNSPMYRTVVLTAKKLAEQGYVIVSGGGPGAMEATHLGAYLANRPMEDVEEALKILATAPSYHDPLWLSRAFEVKRRFPPRQGAGESLSIATWLYGHEPPCIFSSHIAKLFCNSIREDTLIRISGGGLVFMPGSAGTLSELFLATERDHYLSAATPAPIIFVNKEYWTKTIPIYPLIRTMLHTRKFQNLLTSLVDSPDDVVNIISDFENIYALMLAKQQGRSAKEHLLSSDRAKEGVPQC